MMEHNDELYLKKTVGNRNPFRVPEGYFEQFTDQLMQQLPEREDTVAKQLDIAQKHVSQTLARRTLLRPLLYAAACTALALMLGVSYYFMQSTAPSNEPAPIAVVATTPATDYIYYEEAADYAMFDNTEIYACLSESY